MPIYKITQKETSSQHIFVEANTKEEAEMIVEDLDNNAWRDNNDYNCQHTSTEIAQEDELLGRLINTQNYCYNYTKT